MNYESTKEIVLTLKTFDVYFSNGESVVIKAHRASQHLYPIIQFERDYVEIARVVVAEFNFDNIAGYVEIK